MAEESEGPSVEPIKTVRCPCCSHMTLTSQAGFECCPVCYWEDDGQDEDTAERVRGGPNGSLSLRQAQENFKRCGASEDLYVDLVRRPLPDEI